jgi:DNA polymerase III sliding clamp (beta) subunit (PCNA family)
MKAVLNRKDFLQALSHTSKLAKLASKGTPSCAVKLTVDDDYGAVSLEATNGFGCWVVRMLPPHRDNVDGACLLSLEAIKLLRKMKGKEITIEADSRGIAFGGMSFPTGGDVSEFPTRPICPKGCVEIAVSASELFQAFSVGIACALDHERYKHIFVEATGDYTATNGYRLAHRRGPVIASVDLLLDYIGTEMVCNVFKDFSAGIPLARSDNYLWFSTTGHQVVVPILNDQFPDYRQALEIFESGDLVFEPDQKVMLEVCQTVRLIPAKMSIESESIESIESENNQILIRAREGAIEFVRTVPAKIVRTVPAKRGFNTDYIVDGLTFMGEHVVCQSNNDGMRMVNKTDPQHYYAVMGYRFKERSK